MAEELVMPRLSDTMEQGTIGRWLVHEGDAIAEGDVIAEIETDKATMEFQAYAPGTVLKILVGDGETVDLGAPIAIVGEPGEEVPDRPQQPPANASVEDAPEEAPAEAPAASPPAIVAAPPRAAQSGNGASGTLRVSPIARRMADAAGLDLGSLAGRGSGPDGRIVKVDVERLLAEGVPAAAPEIAEVRRPEAPAPAEDEVRELTPMLKAIAHRMAESKATVPHFYVTAEIDMTRAVQMRAELNEGLAGRGSKISLNDLIVRACAMALIDHPQAHRSYVEGHHVYHAHANVGIAVALDDGLIVPVVREADRKSVLEISAEARDLAGRARSGGLKQREIEGATFTVSNLGMFGVSQFSAIINPPESAILAVGATVERPVVVDGQMAVRSIMAVTLACDHRACSGADGARLLQTITRNLQAPSLLLA
jgi:pyruvate dehydrogenase E2 component (dihydrolipoamide acetyltransferase)